MTLFNKCKYLPESIESILEQTYSKFGLIAMDNASTDQTETIMKSYMEKDSRISPHFFASSKSDSEPVIIETVALNHISSFKNSYSNIF